jgi:hypothetical protein
MVSRTAKLDSEDRGRTVGGGSELAMGSKSIRHENLEEDRAEVRMSQVDRGGVSC